MKYSKVPHSVVEEAWFRDADDHARTLALWLWLSPRGLAIPGVVKARAGVVADDLRWSAKRMRTALGHLVGAGVVLVDDAAGVMFLPAALRESDGAATTMTRPGSGTAAITWARCLDEIQTGPGLAAILDAVEPHLTPFVDENRNEIADRIAKARVRVGGISALGSPAHSHSHSHRSQTQEQRESTPRPAARAGSLLSPAAGDRDPDPDPDPDPEGNRGKVTNTAPKAPRKPSKAPTPVDPAHDPQPAIDAWWAGYEHVTGAKPTRHAKHSAGHFANVTRLCREHGHAEVTRRMGALLGGALAWFDGTPDLGSLARHFDKLPTSTPAPPARRRFLEYGGDDSPKVATPPIPFPLDPEAVAAAAQELADGAWHDYGGHYSLAREVRDQFEAHHHRAPSDAELHAAKAIGYQLWEAERARVEAERAALAEKRKREEAEAAAHEAAHPDIVKIINRWRATAGQAPAARRRQGEPGGLAAALAFNPEDLQPSRGNGARRPANRGQITDTGPHVLDGEIPI